MSDIAELRKWLNEEPSRPLDRAALARVLHDLERLRAQVAPAGYVTAIDEGKVLFLPRPSLNIAGMVPIYAAPAQQAGPYWVKCDGGASCQPHATECPRCKDDLTKCDGGAAQQAEPVAQVLAGAKALAMDHQGGWDSLTQLERGRLLDTARTVLDAQPSAQGLDVVLDEDEADLLRQTIGDAEEAAPVRLLVGDGHSGYGLYAAQADYQEEGAVLLHSMPSPAA